MPSDDDKIEAKLRSLLCEIVEQFGSGPEGRQRALERIEILFASEFRKGNWRIYKTLAVLIGVADQRHEMEFVDRFLPMLPKHVLAKLVIAGFSAPTGPSERTDVEEGRGRRPWYKRVLPLRG